MSLILLVALVVVTVVVLVILKRMEKKNPPANAEEPVKTNTTGKRKNGRSVAELLPIQDIKHGLIYTDDGITAVIGVDSIHYHLLSESEKQAVDGALASLLASLSFPVQPLSITRPVDLKDYIVDLKKLVDSTDGVLREYGYDHLSFLESRTRQEIMIKQDYFVFSCPWQDDEEQTKAELDRRAGLIISGLRRAGMIARVLDTPQVAEIFFDIFHANKPITARVKDAFTEDYFALYVSKEEQQKPVSIFPELPKREIKHEPVSESKTGGETVREKEEMIIFS